MLKRRLRNITLEVLLLLLIAIEHHHHLNVAAFSTSSKAQSLSSSSSISPSDLQSIQKQLGYIPTNLLSISARTKDSTKTPIALKTYPLNGGSKHRNRKSSSSSSSSSQNNKTPFPTLFWLCHSDIHTAISNLERMGHVKLLERRLMKDERACINMRKSHEDYAKLRWDVLSLEDQEYLQHLNRDKKKDDDDDCDGSTTTTTTTAAAKSSSSSSSTGILQMIKYSGVAGSNYLSTNVPSVKCLHAHYAHYRSTNDDMNDIDCDYKDDEYEYDEYECSNIIGKWTHDLLEEQFPELVL